MPTKKGDREIRYLICNNHETLLYLGHLDVIELHPWSSHVDLLQCPDWMIFDLDPGPTCSFLMVVAVAQIIHQLLLQKGYTCACKTSGKRGLHIYAALDEEVNFDTVRQLAHSIAAEVVERVPEIASLEYQPDKRQDKVHIDVLRNAYGQTTIAPYSPRGTNGATVSTPLAWEEVTPTLNPEKFTITSVIERLQQTGDPWSKLLTK